MAKLNRSQLKGIVKECLLEILSEGLASKTVAPTRPSRRQAPPEQGRRQGPDHP